MSEIKPSAAPVAILLVALDADSKSPATLRVKPDRRRTHMPFPEALDRRIARPEIALVAPPLRAGRST